LNICLLSRISPTLRALFLGAGLGFSNTCRGNRNLKEAETKTKVIRGIMLNEPGTIVPPDAASYPKEQRRKCPR